MEEEEIKTDAQPEPQPEPILDPEAEDEDIEDKHRSFLFNVRLSNDLKKRLEAYALENDMAMTQVVRMAIRRLIKKR